MTHFSALDVNTATDTLCSTLTSCMDHICPLSSRPARAAPSNSWLSDVLRESSVWTQGSREKMEQIKRSVRPEFLSVFASIFLCWSPHCQGFILPQQDQQRIWHTQSLQNIHLSPLSPSTTSLTADDFATFFTNKTRSISSQFPAPHTQDLKPTTYTDKTPLFSFSPLTEAEESRLLSSHPTTCPLDSIPSNLLLHSYQHSHTSTHLSLQAPSQLHSSRLGNPTTKKKHI